MRIIYPLSANLCLRVTLNYQAREKDEKDRLHKQQELDDNMTEIANHVFGDVLTENPAVAQSAFGPHRVITDRWKGMSPQELEDIRRQQAQQRAEKEVLRNLSMLNFLTHPARG